MPILRYRDINVYYEIAGAGDPLLFIHGLGSSHRDWEPQVAFFSRHYQVITYDVRGHGKSETERWAENDTRAYLQALKAIVGWSVAERIRAIRCPTLVITAD